MIPYGRQSIDGADVDAVVKVMRSEWLTQGPTVTAFEQRLVKLTGAAHAVAFSSGTAALHAAAAAGGLGPGDLVAASPLSFVASANRNDTLSWPLNPAAGVTVMVRPEAVARPLPVAPARSPTPVGRTTPSSC